MPLGLLADLEDCEDHLTAHCVRDRTTAVLIYRDSEGREFRRLIGPKGSMEISPAFGDGTVLARLQMQANASDSDLLAIDAAITQAQACGERVMIL